jgi:hypothetical protein
VADAENGMKSREISERMFMSLWRLMLELSGGEAVRLERVVSHGFPPPNAQFACGD